MNGTALNGTANGATKGEPTLGALLGSLVTDTGTLVRQEIHLASTEMGEKAKNATAQVGMISLGGALAHAGLLSLIAALVIGLGALIPMWISAMAIGLVAAGVGWALIHKGTSALHQLDPVPQRTLETLHQDKSWMKEQFR